MMALSDHAMLVSLHVPSDLPTRTDRARGAAITQEAGARKRTARVGVSVYSPDDTWIGARRRIATRLRVSHAAITSPYDDSGSRLLARSQRDGYHATIAPLIEALAAADAEVQSHRWEIHSAAQSALAGLYDRAATDRALDHRVIPVLQEMPVPDWSTVSWRDELSHDEMAALIERQAARDAELMAGATTDVLRRVVLLLGGIPGDPNNRGVLARLESGQWRGDALSQVRELVAVLPGLVQLCGGPAADGVRVLAGELERLAAMQAPSALAGDGPNQALESVISPVRGALSSARALLGIPQAATVSAPAVAVAVPEVVEVAAPELPSAAPAVDDSLFGGW